MKKPRALLQSLILVSGIGVLANELSTTIVNTFSFDIFNKCVTGEYAVTDTICQDGPAVLTNVVAAVLFFLMGMVALRQVANITITRTHLLLLALTLLIALSIVWRVELSLRDNFRFTAGPETAYEYLYVGFFWARPIVASLVVGFAAWLPMAVNRTAKMRKEPRVDFKK